MINAAFLWQLATENSVTIPDDEKWFMIRNYRNELLTKSDWSQLGDAPFSAEEKNTWTAYRQALRDVPQDFGNPDDVMFPGATMTTRKQIGDQNQKARARAMTVLLNLRGQNVADLKNKDVLALIALLLQWLGLADEHGVIK